MNNAIIKIESNSSYIRVYFGYPEACDEFAAKFPKSMAVKIRNKIAFGNPVEGYDVVPTAEVRFDNNTRITGGVNETGDKRRARFEKELAAIL